MTSIDTQDDIKEYIIEEGKGNNFIERKYYDFCMIFSNKEMLGFTSPAFQEKFILHLMGSTNKFVQKIRRGVISFDDLLKVQQQVLEIIDLSDSIVQIIK